MENAVSFSEQEVRDKIAAMQFDGFKPELLAFEALEPEVESIQYEGIKPFIPHLQLDYETAIALNIQGDDFENYTTALAKYLTEFRPQFLFDGILPSFRVFHQSQCKDGIVFGSATNSRVETAEVVLKRTVESYVSATSDNPRLTEYLYSKEPETTDKPISVVLSKAEMHHTFYPSTEVYHAVQAGNVALLQQPRTYSLTDLAKVDPRFERP